MFWLGVGIWAVYNYLKFRYWFWIPLAYLRLCKQNHLDSAKWLRGLQSLAALWYRKIIFSELNEQCYTFYYIFICRLWPAVIESRWPEWPESETFLRRLHGTSLLWAAVLGPRVLRPPGLLPLLLSLRQYGQLHEREQGETHALLSYPGIPHLLLPGRGTSSET